MSGLPFSVLKRLKMDTGSLEAPIAWSEAMLAQAEQVLRLEFDAALRVLETSPARTQVYNARKVFFQKNKLPDQPLPLPGLERAAQLYRQAQKTVEQARIQAQNSWENALLAQYSVLQAWARDEGFQRALLLAAPGLLAQIPAFLAVAPAHFTKKERHIALSLAKYLTRMASKTTPFGRLAKVAMPLDAPEGDTDFLFDEAQAFTRQDTIKITPNVALLDAIYTVLLAYPVFYHSLSVRLHPMITDAQSARLQWWYFNGTNEAVQQTANNPTLQFIATLLLENGRSMPFSQLQAALSARSGADPTIADQYLNDLCDIGWLEWQFPESGFSPSWCGKLYQYLGFLEGGSAETVITDTAFLLHWLRTAARTLAFQPIEEALQTLRDTDDQVRAYFEKYAGEAPEIPMEQLFFEDVATHFDAEIPEEVLLQWQQTLRERLNAAPPAPFIGMRQKVAAILEQGPMDMATLAAEVPKSLGAHAVPARPISPLGVLVQPFRDSDGRWKAVLNALYPGGGKLFARWLFLFPAQNTELLRRFYRQFPQLVAFAAYRRSNINMHPPLTDRAVQLPGDATVSNELLAGDLRFELDDEGHIAVYAGGDRTPLLFTDPGLEELSARPALLQAVLLAGYPRAGKDLIAPPAWQSVADGLETRARATEGDWIWYRAAWRLEPAVVQGFLTNSGYAFFIQTRRWMLDNGIPTAFFIKNTLEKPQYVDLDSPISVILLEKMWRKMPDAIWIIEEVLPGPETEMLEMGLEWD